MSVLCVRYIIHIVIHLIGGIYGIQKLIVKHEMSNFQILTMKRMSDLNYDLLLTRCALICTCTCTCTLLCRPGAQIGIKLSQIEINGALFM